MLHRWAVYSAAMRVLGIDPGYHRCGYAVLDAAGSAQQGAVALAASGAIVTTQKVPLALRLNELAAHLDQLLALWQPQSVAVEEIFFTSNAKTAIGVAQARGVILQRAAAAGVAVAEYTPTMVKSPLTGNGRADTAQVAFMVRQWFSMLEERRLDDELDAIAVGLCHCQRVSLLGVAPVEAPR